VYAPKKNKWSKIVIMKNVFTLEEIENDEIYGEVKEDMTEAAEQWGPITNCTIYDKEPEGIVTVRFRDADDAEKFFNSTFQGKGYNGHKVQLTIAEDKPRFRKSGRGVEIDSEEEEERLEKLVQQ
jgi:HIV Tat-specific factor 1